MTMQTARFDDVSGRAGHMRKIGERQFQEARKITLVFMQASSESISVGEQQKLIYE